VKPLEKHINKLIFSIALFLIFGNIAIAAEGFNTKPKNPVVWEFQENDQKPFEIHKISIGDASQTVSHNEYIGLGFVEPAYSNQAITTVHISNFSSYYSLKDKRELIFRHLFPFHFFW